MPFRSAAALILLLPLCGACAAPASRPSTMGLEPPVMSPPGDMSAQERLDWWQRQIPRLSSVDRSEARLAMGELALQLGQAKEARIAFYEAKGGRLAARELAQAERGIGLSYFLEGKVGLGVPHLKRSRQGLEGPAQQEVDYLMAAASGKAIDAKSTVLIQRMSVYLEASQLAGPLDTNNSNLGSKIVLDLTRAQWGAATMQSNWDPMTTPYRIAIHHTAEPITSTSVSASAAEVRGIQAIHMKDRGFADIGYHYLIDRAGRVIEGRPMYAQGAHASDDFNIGNIGICLLGNFSSQSGRGSEYFRAQRPSPAQMETLDRLVDQLCAIYAIQKKQVKGHRDYKSTECPGDELSNWAARYRQGR